MLNQQQLLFLKQVAKINFKLMIAHSVCVIFRLTISKGIHTQYQLYTKISPFASFAVGLSPFAGLWTIGYGQ